MCISGPRRAVSVVVKIVASDLDGPSGHLPAVTAGKLLNLFGLLFYILQNSHTRNIKAQPSSQQHSASNHEVLLCEAGVGPVAGLASRLDCWPQLQTLELLASREDSPAPRAWTSGEQMAPGRSWVASQPEGRPDGHKDPLLSS